MKKVAVTISLSLVLGFLILFGSAYVWLFYTHSGLLWSLGEIQKVSNGLIEYGSVKGAWLTEVEFDRLNVNAEPVFIKTNHTLFHLSLRRILSAKLEVVTLHADNVTVLHQPQTVEPSNEKTAKSGFSLPVSVDVHSLSIDTFDFQQKGQSPLVLNQVKGSNSSIRKQIDIGRLSAESRFGSMVVSGRVEPVKNGKLTLDAQFMRNASGDIPSIKGSATIGGTFEQLSIHAKLSKPYDILADASLNSTQAVSTWHLNVNATTIPLRSSFEKLPFTLTHVALTGGGNFSDYTIKGVTGISIENKGDWDADFNVDKTSEQWKINKLVLTNQAVNSMFSVTGTVHSGFSFNSSTLFALQANWKNAQWPLINTPEVASQIGTLQIDGSMKNYNLTSGGSFRWTDKEITNMDLVANGSFNKLVFSRISGDYNHGHIDGNGAVEIGAQPSWQAQAKVSTLDLNGFLKNIKTSLNASVDIDGSYKQDKFSGSFLLKDLSGTVNKKPVAGKARIAIDGTNIQVSALALRSGKNSLRGNLDYHSKSISQPGRINATWNLKMQDLGLVQTNMKGALDSKGSISGELDRLSGKATVNANDVFFNQFRINKLNIDTAFDLSDKNPSHFLLTVNHALIHGISINSVQVNLKGKLAQQSIDVKAVEGENNILRLNGQGSWRRDQWHFKWANTQWDSKTFGNWHQKQTVNVIVSATELKLDGYCLVKSQQTSFCGSINSQAYKLWDGKLTFSDIPFEMFSAYLPPQFASTAVNLNGQGTFKYMPSSGVIMDFSASGKNGIISGIQVEGEEKKIPFNQFNVDVSNKAEQLDAKTSIDFGKTGSVDIALSFPGWTQLRMPDLKQKIKGNVIVNLNNLTLLSVISNQIKEPVGQWHSNITISGTLGAPVLLGESKLTASSLTITRLGLKLQDVKFSINSNEKRVVNISGTAKSGEGSINISGHLNDYRAATPTGMLKITGKNFEMAHLPEATVIGAPDLTLSLEQNALDVNGDVTISEADLKIFTPVKTISPSPDVVIVSAKEPEAKQSTLKLRSKIRIILGKKVKVQGYGFTGRVEGTLLVDDTHALPTASGEIKIVDGKFAAYGTELDISEGRLSFTGGPIDNPLIDVRAERHPNDTVTVGLVVEGSVKSPKISLFSQPSMDDSDILSYIILGTPMSGASRQQGQVLANAAASLGLIGGEKLAKKIGERFGIDKIELQTDQATQDTSLLLGKYLSPDFFIGYAIGIGNAVNSLQIQYKLTDQLMLKTQSGQSQKAEILFSIEKD